MLAPRVAHLHHRLHVLVIALPGIGSQLTVAGAGSEDVGNPVVLEVGVEVARLERNDARPGGDAEHVGARRAHLHAEEGGVSGRLPGGGVDTGAARGAQHADVIEPLPLDRVLALAEGAVEEREVQRRILGQEELRRLEEHVVRAGQGRGDGHEAGAHEESGCDAHRMLRGGSDNASSPVICAPSVLPCTRPAAHR